jgi:hypothetical protein
MSSPSPGVIRYRPRTEGLFARITHFNPHSSDELAILASLDAIVGQNAASCGGLTGAAMADPTGEADKGALRLDFDRRLLWQFRGSTITSDARLLPYRELDDALRLTGTGSDKLLTRAPARTVAIGWPVCWANRCSDGWSATRT